MYCGRGPNFRTRPIIIIKSYRNERLRTPTPSASRRKSRKPAGVSGRRIPWPRVRRRAASNFPPRRRRCVSPDRLASRARRRRLAYSGPLPPALAPGSRRAKPEYLFDLIYSLDCGVALYVPRIGYFFLCYFSARRNVTPPHPPLKIILDGAWRCCHIQQRWRARLQDR